VIFFIICAASAAWGQTFLDSLVAQVNMLAKDYENEIKEKKSILGQISKNNDSIQTLVNNYNLCNDSFLENCKKERREDECEEVCVSFKQKLEEFKTLEDSLRSEIAFLSEGLKRLNVKKKIYALASTNSGYAESFDVLRRTSTLKIEECRGKANELQYERCHKEWLNIHKKHLGRTLELDLQDTNLPNRFPVQKRKGFKIWNTNCAPKLITEDSPNSDRKCFKEGYNSIVFDEAEYFKIGLQFKSEADAEKFEPHKLAQVKCKILSIILIDGESYRCLVTQMIPKGEQK
jgi:hypothetical protein